MNRSAVPTRVRRTKILATVGPASASEETLLAMMDAGMDAVRVNFSHGTEAERERLMGLVRVAAESARRAIPLVQDLSGTKMRIGKIHEGRVHLHRGDLVRLDADPAPGDATRIGIEEPRLLEAASAGQHLLFGDGEIALSVVSQEDGALQARVEQGGVLRSGVGVTAPGVPLPGGLTEKDREDLKVGARHDVEWVALSFVRDAAEVREAREALVELGHPTPIIAKIERLEALDSLGEIIREADAVLVARGDLGLALPPEEVPVWQKRILHACAHRGRPSITATQMLESMVVHARPTRAEASDVANAILDGTHAVMLSGETAIGAHPVGAVGMMDRIARSAERSLMDGTLPVTPHRAESEGNVADAISLACAVTAEDLEARWIVAFTRSGSTAVRVTRHRSRVPILAATPDPVVARRLGLLWGVTAVVVPDANSLDEMVQNAESAAKERGLVTRGDLVVLTGGDLGVAGSTNLMRVTQIS